MDPGRWAMIEGRKSPTRRDITSPRRDPTSRINKSSRPSSSRPPVTSANNTKIGGAGKYLSSDDQSRQFVADEDKFVLTQAKKKADIRVRDGRAKPIDYLAFNLRFVDTDRDLLDDDDGDLDINVPAPVAVLAGLDEPRLKELREDITSYHTLETNSRNREYWEALLTICDDKKAKLMPRGPEGRAVNSVASEIDGILAPKSLEQLEALEKQIKAKLQSQEPIDTDYWEELLKSLLIWKAKAKLEKVSEDIKTARVGLLERVHPEGAAALEESQVPVSSSPSTDRKPGQQGQSSSQKFAAMALSASASGSAPPPGTERFATAAPEDFTQSAKAHYGREMAKGIGENEEIFTEEEAVPSSTKPVWAEKHRPRKPQYLNRVLMGYEWNKYNQTHYDHDNPPPKVVQGYKFNIFYPDLIDKTKAPTFKIIREHGRRRGESFAPAGQEDTCLIRFIAGPPYEDLAFRIVDREWDYSAKKERGFRSSFDKGILQLHFQFKKIFYRK